jgi:deoxyribodipyrimidine photolyase
MLVDHEVCANYANWVFGAGVATKGQRQNRFNIAKQALENEDANKLVRMWLPELSKVEGASH